MKEVSRQEFDDLKNDVKDLKKVFDKINTIAVSTEKLAIEMKYIYRCCRRNRCADHQRSHFQQLSAAD